MTSRCTVCYQEVSENDKTLVGKLYLSYVANAGHIGGRCIIKTLIIILHTNKITKMFGRRSNNNHITKNIKNRIEA